MKTLHSYTFLAWAAVLGSLTLGNWTTQATPYNWTNSASGGWNTAANWNPNGVPASADTAIITNAGVIVSLNSATTVGGIILGTNGAGPVTLGMNGQTLALNGPLTVNPSGSFTVDSPLIGNTNAVLSGTMNLTSGSLGGILTLAASSTMTFTTGNNHNLPNLVFTNNGTVVWTAGTIQGGGGAPGTLIYNNGLWNAQDDLTWNNAYGANGTVFNNNSGGTLRKSGSGIVNGSTLFNSGFVINNNGKLDSQTNYLNFQGGGNLTGGTATNLTGLVSLNGGAFNISGTVTSTNVQLAGGTLTGNNVINGALNWISGDWNNSASETIAPGATLLITSGNNHDVRNCIITNNGTVVWAAGAIQAGGGAPGTLIYNNGLWNAQDDLTWNNAYGANGTVFNNNSGGTLRKSGSGIVNGSTLFNSGFVINNNGKLDSQTNYLNFQGGGNLTGGTATNLNGYVYLGSGAFNINGTVTSTNTQLAGGTLTGNNVINGGLNWIYGDWNGSASETIAAGATLLITSGNNHNIQNCTITNNGTVVWAAGAIQAGGNSPGTFIYNNGLWDCQSDQGWNNAYAGFGTVFNNAGTFRKSGSTGGNTTLNGGVVFNNTGKLDAQTNYIVLSGGGNLTGGTATNLTGLVSLNGGAFNINGTVTSTNVQLAGGTLTGNNVINGALNWVVGLWNGSAVTIAANATLLVTSANAHDMANCTVTNNGTVNWASGQIRGGANPSGTVIYNYGLWDAQSDQQLNNDYAGVGTVFNNLGTFRKSGGAGALGANYTLFTGGVLFNQLAGVVDVQNGTNGLELVLAGGGNFTGGFITANANGYTILNAGSFNLNGTVTGTNTWENNGNLVGTNVINGALTWVGGNWNGAPFVTIATNSTVIAAGGGGVLDMSATTVANNGTFAWVSGAQVRGGATTVINNNGLWDCQGDQQLNSAYGAGTVFNNFGTLRKSGGAGIGPTYTLFAGGVLFNQLAGVVDVQNGTNGLELAFSGGGNLTGGYFTTNYLNATNYGLAVLSGGNFTINGAVTTTNVLENAGNLIGTNVIRGGLTWGGGNWNSAPFVTIATNSTVIAAGGGGVLDMSATTVTNNGTFAWVSGAQVRGGATTVINNNGLWDCQSDQLLTSAYSAGMVFNNFGTFRKSGTSGGSSQIQNGVSFNNPGTLDSQRGNISLQGAYSLTSGTLNVGINSLTNNGTISLAGAAPLAGTVSANLNNGYVPISGNSFTNLYYGSYTGGFTNATLPLADAWTTNYFPTYFVLTVLNARPVLAALSTNKFVVNELTTLNVTNSATDADLPPQTLTYSLSGATNGMAINPATGVFTWTPQQTNSPSTNNVIVVVTDNGTPPLSATNTFTVIVREVNYAPTLPTIGLKTVNALALLTVTNTATETNIHATLGYYLVNPPTGAAINANGIITWTPPRPFGPGTNVITTVVTNTDAFDQTNPHLSDTNSFTVIVYAPTLAPISDATVNPGQTVSFTATATDNDSTRTLTFSVVSGPGSIGLNSGAFSWRPPANNGGSSNFVQVQVQDNSAPPVMDTKGFAVIVNALAPVELTPIAYTNGQFVIQISGTVGPDYILQAASTLTNSAAWVNLQTNTPVSSPFNITDGGAGAFIDRFYRVKLGP